MSLCSADSAPMSQLWASVMVFIALLMALYSGLIESHAQRASQSVKTKRAYLYVLRIMGCMLLTSFGNVMKTLIAKVLSCHFYCSGYFDKMQDALRKVRAAMCFCL